MPSATDLYFPPADIEREMRWMSNAALRPIPSIWGRRPGSPGLNAVDTKFVDDALRELLAR